MNKHHCEGILPSEAYGEAITHCIEDDNGKLWAGNDEYSSQVNFCPYCGFCIKDNVNVSEDKK